MMRDKENRSGQPLLVIFDCDGVLVDSELATNAVISINLARYGLSLSAMQCKERFMGGQMIDVMQAAIKMGAALPEGWINEIYSEVHARLEAGVPVIDGIVDILDQLDRAAIPYCVASNGSEKKMSITLGNAGLWTRFGDRIFSAHTIGHAKPDPGLFLHAANHFAIAPKDCVVIEDSATGAKAARRARMRCYGYATDSHSEELAAEGALLFHEMRALSGHLMLHSTNSR